MNIPEGSDETVEAELALLAFFMHEIKATLGAVQHYLAVAMRINKDPKVEERIDGASEHIVLLSKLLTELQIGYGRAGPVNLETMWASAVGGCKAVLDEHDIAVSEDVPELVIYGRSNDLTAMFTHLLSDVVRATGRGIVTLEVSVRESVELVISGQLALDASGRTRSSHSDRRRGTGLPGGAVGQAIASLIAKHHGGSIDVLPDNGFRVTLPANPRLDP